MIRFRPLLAPTLWFVPMFILLMGLGFWQIQRLHWKLGLIAEMDAAMVAPPLSLDGALALGERAQYRMMMLRGRFLNDSEAFVYTTDPEGAPVYHVLTPLRLDDGRVLMFDRGFIPTTLADPRTRIAPGGEHLVFGIWRTPDGPGIFTPAPDLAHRVWYARDLASIAKADHVKLAAPVIVEADVTPNPGGWPRGGQTMVNLPNSHMQYALTWFGLAGGLLGVYLAYHITNGRLRFGRA
ncbi:MAG TPA: SURF1 family protein [Rhizomicrobium sp.]|jgi:surfeit locus 1 family protein|nr:SURF1 family protein [Rhizomicrobium sp.]